MSDEIVISHAYNGFIYLPLFLAKHLGYFPQNVRLRYAQSDEEAVQELMHPGNATAPQSAFAVCDPLMVSHLSKIIGEREFGQPDPPLVVGSLIKRTPIWLFNSSPAITPVFQESELAGRVSKIRCYQRPNTGYVIARRLQALLSVSDDQMHFTEVPFNSEFNDPIPSDMLVVTSDVLHMAQLGFNNNNIVFSYASKPSDVREMFFTGILTRKSLFENDLALVLAVLAGIRKAITKIFNDDIDVMTDLTTAMLLEDPSQYSLPLAPTALTLRPLVKASIQDILRREVIYSEDLEIAKDAWERSITVRQKAIPGWHVPTYEAFTERIPVILLQSDWRQRVTIKSGGEVMVTISSSWWTYVPHLQTLIGALFLLVAVPKTYRTLAAASATQFGETLLKALLFLVILLASFVPIFFLRKDVRSNLSKQFPSDLSWWFVLIGLSLSAFKLL
jgi:hypothetical protein